MRILLFSIFIFFIPVKIFSQILPTPIWNVLPCYGAPGTTVIASVIPVPGATGYIWTTDTTQVNGILYNGQISPASTATPGTDITFVLPQPIWNICVTAVSSCCTSATVCAPVYGVAPFGFNPLNSTQATPGSSGL